MTLEKRVSTVWVAAALAMMAVSAPAGADQCINDDQIVDGSACIGLDCVCN